MSTPKELSDRVVEAYNERDFDALESMLHENLDFAHFNHGDGLSTRKEFMGLLKMSAKKVITTRVIEEPERVLECGNTIIREGYFSGTPAIDLPGFSKAGEPFRIKVCSVWTFNDDGLIVEWKDYG